jgi:molybdenum cofactor cytidylyltransferase
MERIEGVILAAGLASRIGRHKMALPLGDGTVIEKSLEGMYGLASKIFVVVGWNAEEIQNLTAAYDKVETVFNREYSSGMFSSVRTGIARIRADRFFLLPGDCPFIERETYSRMLSARGDIVIPVFKGRKGHPVLINGGLVPEILDLPEGETLRDYIEAKGYSTIDAGYDGILFDIDTPEDYRQALNRCSPPDPLQR